MHDFTAFIIEANRCLQALEKASSVEEVRQGIAQLAAKLVPHGKGWATFLLSRERHVLEPKIPERWFPDGSYKPIDQNEKREWKIGKDGLTGYVAATKKIVRVDDVTSGGMIQGTHELIDKWYVEVDSQTLSELVLPCVTGDRLMGVLNLECYEKAAFGPEHEVLGQLIASQAARLVLQKTREQFIEAISQAENLEDLTYTIVHKLPEVVGALACAIFLLDRKSNQIIYHDSNLPLYAGSIRDKDRMREVQRGEPCYNVKGLGITRWVFDYDIPLITNVIYPTGLTEEEKKKILEQVIKYHADKYHYEGFDGDDRVHWLFRSKDKNEEGLVIPEPIWSNSLHDSMEGCHELMLVPIQGLEGKQPLGVVRVGIREGTNLSFTPEDLSLLLRAARQMGIIIESLEKTREALEEEKEIHNILSIDTADWREEFRERVEPVLKNIYSALGCDMVLVRMLDDLGKNLIAVAHYPLNLPDGLDVIKRKPVGAGGSGLAVEKGETVFIDDASQHICMLKMRADHKKYLEDLQRRLEECSANQNGRPNEEKRLLKLIERAEREDRFLEEIGSECAVPLAIGENHGEIVGVISAVSFQVSTFKLGRRDAANSSNWQVERTGVQVEDQVVLEYYCRRLAEAVAIARVLAKRQRQLEAVTTAAASMQGRSEEEDIYRDALIAATHEEGLGFHQAFVLSEDKDDTWRINHAWGTASPEEQSKAWEWVSELGETLTTSTWANCGALKGRSVGQIFDMGNNPTEPCLVVKGPSDQRTPAHKDNVKEDSVKIVSADDIGALRFMETLGYDVIAMAPFRVQATGSVQFLLGTRKYFTDSDEPVFRRIEKSDVQVLKLLGDQIGSALEHLNQRKAMRLREQEALRLSSYMVAHRLRNVLPVISERLKRTLERGAVTGKGTEWCHVALDQTRRAQKIVTDFEVFARAEVFECPDVLSGTELVQRIGEVVKENLLQTGAKVKVRAAPNLPSVRVSVDRLSDDFAAFVRDSERHKPSGLCITISCECASEADIQRVGLQSRRSHLKLIYTDNGPGVPTGLKQRIFEPFYTTTGGSGLGLAIAMHNAGVHGGTLVECGQQGHGVRFELHLPTVPVLGEEE